MIIIFRFFFSIGPKCRLYLEVPATFSPHFAYLAVGNRRHRLEVSRVARALCDVLRRVTVVAFRHEGVESDGHATGERLGVGHGDVAEL